MTSPYLKVIALFALTFIWFYSTGLCSYWLVCRYIRTKRALKLLNYIQSAMALIGCCLALFTLKSVEHIGSIPINERSGDGFGLFLASIGSPMIAVFLTMRLFFPKQFKAFWEIRTSLREKTDE